MIFESDVCVRQVSCQMFWNIYIHINTMKNSIVWWKKGAASISNWFLTQHSQIRVCLHTCTYIQCIFYVHTYIHINWQCILCLAVQCKMWHIFHTTPFWFYFVFHCFSYYCLLPTFGILLLLVRQSNAQ